MRGAPSSSYEFDAWSKHRYRASGCYTSVTCLQSSAHSLASAVFEAAARRYASTPSARCGFVRSFESHREHCWACSEGSPPQTEAADGGRAGLKRNDNNYLLRRFFFGARFEAGAEAPPPPPAAFWSALFVARVGAAAMGSSGHGCFGYLPRCSARTEG